MGILRMPLQVPFKALAGQIREWLEEVITR